MPDSAGLRGASVTRCSWQRLMPRVGDVGQMMGWESDKEVVGPVVFAVKSSVLGLMAHVLPPEDPRAPLYRLVLDHVDYGIHNMVMATDDVGGTRMILVLGLGDCGCCARDPRMAMSMDCESDEVNQN
ncbi:hypothetical protein LTR08_005087 [Meristemomyces frigidus]|nr:hypothetical protein LTR08_005087 [Meristemomyces frigidus]